MKLSSVCLYAVLIVLFLFNVTTHATEAKKVPVVKAKPYEASALPGIDLTPKRELVKFVPCTDENDCLRALQESDIDTAQAAGKSDEGVALVAEYVDGPQKGIRVYRNK